MTSESRFDLSALPATCLDCKRVCSAIANAVAMRLLLEENEKRLSDCELTADFVESYIAVVETSKSLASSTAVVDGAAQQIIDSYGTMSMMFGCGGNLPSTGDCGLNRAMFKNPYR